MDSYLSMRAHAGVVAQELLQAVAERMDVPQGELVLVAVTYPGGEYHSHQPPAIYTNQHHCHLSVTVYDNKTHYI